MVSNEDNFSAHRRVATSARMEAEYDNLAIKASTASLGDNSRTLN